MQAPRPPMLSCPQYIFGVSEWEIFGTLSHGATLALLSPAAVKQPVVFAQTLIDVSAAVAFLVPSHLDVTLAAFEVLARDPAYKRPARLRHIVCCGEPLQIATAVRFYELGRGSAGCLSATAVLHNVYGPTEASMTAYRVPSTVNTKSEMCIGTAISNTVVVLLNEDMEPERPQSAGAPTHRPVVHRRGERSKSLATTLVRI